ncbi:MAG: hypothetical protein EBR55_04425 [Chitinophagia bacterium]|nr:hypothetical protein [Chitinophagia bacterium]
MSQYKYNHHEERGHFDAFVLDENDNVVFEVHYPDFYEDEESGELIEGTTIFEDGFMKNPHDVDGLEKHLKSLGVLKEEDELVMEYANGGYVGKDDAMEDGGETPQGKIYQKVKISIYDVDMGGDKIYSGEHWFPKDKIVEKSNKELGEYILKKYMFDYGNTYTYKVTRTQEFKERMADGGRIVSGIKSKLSKKEKGVYPLPIEVTVLVPSTINKNEQISKVEFANRIDETQKFLFNLFGGFTSKEAEGGFTSEDKGLINENVFDVTSFASVKDFRENFEKLVNQIKKWCVEWKQESIGLIFEGDMYHIDKDIIFADGGLVNGNKEMVKSQIKEIKHHANELENTIDKQSDVEAWVVGKMERSTTDLSDVTHYLDGRSEYKKGGNVEQNFNPVLIYYEKEGNFIVPKNLVYAWLYDEKDAGEKLETGEYMYPMFPFARPSFSFRGTPPLLQVWTKKYQEKIIGSNHLIGIIQGFYIPEEKKLYIEMQTTRKDMRRKGVMSYMVKALREEFNLDKDDVVFEDLTPMGEKFVKSGKYEDGGEMAKGGEIKSIRKRVDEINALIKLGNENDIEVVDESTTWESPMKFKPIKYSNGVLYVEYQELDLYSYLKGRGTKYETKKFKVTKYDTSSGFEAGESQRNELNDIAKMYRKALRINGITYEDGGMMDDMQMAKSSARANIGYDDAIKDAMEYAGSEWLNMTKSQKDELISEMYHQRKQHISSFARGGMVNLDEYKNIDELIELYKVNSKWYAYGKRYNHETTGSGYTKKEALEDLDTHLSYVSPRDEYNDGGEIEEEEEYDYENDLFNNVKSLPQDVQNVLEKYNEDWEYTYENCANMQDELEELGYTFDYYLDATPYNLRKMEDGGMMAKGGITAHGLKTADKIIGAKTIGTTILVYNGAFDEYARVDLENGKRTKVVYDKKTKKYIESKAMGGETFDDKVQSISKSLLERKKVAPSVQKDYGKTYNKQEALDSARRIVGSMVKKSKN